MPESQWAFVSYHRLLTDLEDTVLDLMVRLLYLTAKTDATSISNGTSESDDTKKTKEERIENENENTREKKNTNGKGVHKTSSGKANVESLSVLLKREQQRARKCLLRKLPRKLLIC
jgi:hypothetical protein